MSISRAHDLNLAPYYLFLIHTFIDLNNLGDEYYTAGQLRFIAQIKKPKHILRQDLTYLTDLGILEEKVDNSQRRPQRVWRLR